MAAFHQPASCKFNKHNEKTRFPFTVRLVPGASGLMQVDEVTMESIYGNARLKRR